MAEEYNINIRNKMGKSGKSSSVSKISAKGSIERAKNTIASTGLLKQGVSQSGKVLSHISSGSAGSLKSIGKSGVLLSTLFATSAKIADFAIEYKTAQTGEQVWGHNAKTSLKTVVSFGMNYVYGFLQNEIFTKQTIHRQNESLDYGRELYQINVEGTKNKRI